MPFAPCPARRRSLRGVRALAVAAVLAVLGGCGFTLPGDDQPSPAKPAPATRAPASQDPATQAAFQRFYGQKIEWRDCDKGFECGSVTVPVDWAQPAGGTIDLALIRKRAGGTRIGSMLVNPGGPGVSGVDFVRAAVAAFGPSVRRAYDIVGWDPRGIGQSAPLHCISDAELDQYVSIDSTPDDAAERTAWLDENAAFAKGCATRGGPLLAHVDTLSTAKDMDVLRAVLGDDVLNYFGASYGTFLGAWYAELFPWRVGRLVLDGAVDPSLDDTGYAEGQAMGFSRALDAYVGQCVGRQGCPLRGTAAQGRTQLGSLVASSDANPLRTSGARKLTQSLMVTALVQGMYSQNDWPRLDKAVTQGLQGDGTGLLELADEYWQRTPDGRFGQTAQANGPIYCLDHPESKTVDQIATEAATLEQKYPVFGASIGWGEVSCLSWPVKPVITPRALRAEGAAPILVLGTTKDPATPYEWAQALAKQLSSGRLITREGFGHTAYVTGNECIDTAVDAYLVGGTIPQQGLVCR